MTTPTKKQRRLASSRLMRAIHVIEAAQNSASVRVCSALIDQSTINHAKDLIYDQVKRLDEEYDKGE